MKVFCLHVYEYCLLYSALLLFQEIKNETIEDLIIDLVESHSHAGEVLRHRITYCFCVSIGFVENICNGTRLMRQINVIIMS